MKTCRIAGCADAYYGKGLCGKHYQRLRTTGTTDDGPRAQLPLADRFWRKVAKAGPDECWLWTGQINPNGYGRISRGLKDEGAISAHRASVEIATGKPVPDDMVVMHKCDNPGCVNPAHLVVGTHAENTADMIAKGRKRTVAPVGNGNGKALLTPDLVRYIRASVEEKSMAEIARELGVGKNTVRGVITGRTWAHVT